jgi:hypothetical protein
MKSPSTLWPRWRVTVEPSDFVIEYRMGIAFESIPVLLPIAGELAVARGGAFR